MIEDLQNELASLENGGRLRTLRPLSARSGCRAKLGERSLINLTSNDYLGLAGDTRLLREFYAGIGEDITNTHGLGAASSRLLAGDSPVYHQLEQELKDAYGAQSALLYNSGYHANIGILPALYGKNSLILSDKLNHASIHDGLRLSRADVRRYNHCDYVQLEKLLERYRSDYKDVVIVTESVFSMDGDVADLARLVEIKKKYNCDLYVDEAHAVGIYGKTGLGKCEEEHLLGEVDLLVGTFGKAFGSVGAYVLCDEVISSYLVNHSRSLIFTTALPPVTVSWNLFVFRAILKMEERRTHLRNLSNQLRADIVNHNLKTDGATNIIPVLIGDNQLTVQAAEMMQQKGYLVFPVRPPTVPEGTSRFRLSLTADMVWDDLASLASDIQECFTHLR